MADDDDQEWYESALIYCRVKGCKWNWPTEYRHHEDLLRKKIVMPSKIKSALFDHIKSHTREEQSEFFAV